MDFSFLVNVLDDGVENVLEHLGMEYVTLDALEGGSVIVAVADALVGHYLKGNEVMTLFGTSLQIVG